jgi:hypothetical protein
LEEVSHSIAYIDAEVLSKLSPYSAWIPLQLTGCDFRICRKCHAPAIRGVCWDFLEEDAVNDAGVRSELLESSNDLFSSVMPIDGEWMDEADLIICYKCKCLKSWHKESSWTDNYDDGQAVFISRYWDECPNEGVPYKYFTTRSKQFVQFLEQHLKYSQENSECLCYWPYRSKIACEISDMVYEKMGWVIPNSALSALMGKRGYEEFPYLVNCEIHQVLFGLFIHAFFYSQYRHILLQLAQVEEVHELSARCSVEMLGAIYELLDEMRPRFLELYSQCLQKHPHPKIHYERGMILFHQGEILDSLNDISTTIDWASKHHDEDLLTSDLYQQEGAIYAELGLYDKAVESLSRAIRKDPNNRDAYLERAGAYFELGSFELSLEDYLISGVKPQPIPSNSVQAVAFSLGLTKGILKGGVQAGVEFIPSVLASLQGIGHGLWAFTQDPIPISLEIVQASQSCIKFVRDHTPKENLTKLVPELRELIEQWNELEDEKKGEIAGHIIGKYGVEIFTGVGISKGMKAYRELRRANNLMTFEAMAISERNRSLIKWEAARRAQARGEILRHANLKIQWDKQGKHIVGHRNFESSLNKSILEHSNPQRLIDDFAGKGMKVGLETPGVPGFEEIVNFEEFIGYVVDAKTGEKSPTNWGKIHYAKSGVHIVPTNARQ